MFRLLLLTTLFAYTVAQLDPETERLINSVFGKNENNAKDTSHRNKDQDCVCVPYYQCNNGTVNTDGSGLIDIRIQEDNPCGTNYLETCCKLGNINKEPVIPSTPPPTPKNSPCGKRNPNGIGFRITGHTDESEYGEFPWMVAVLRQKVIPGTNEPQDVYVCGGALVHPRAVITAAHCVSDMVQKFKIRAGEWDTATEDELFPFQHRDVVSVTIHPQYYRGALFNDIAFLVLDSPVDLMETVDIVCLPSQELVIDNTRCLVSGWGKNNRGTYQNILKKLDLPIVQRNSCQERFRTTRLGKYFQLHESFICAGGEPEKDTCKGDGGSPLVCPIPGRSNRFYQAGIVAWGIDCGKDIPGAYVNVAHFRNWIDQQMATNNLDRHYHEY